MYSLRTTCSIVSFAFPPSPRRWSYLGLTAKSPLSSQSHHRRLSKAAGLHFGVWSSWEPSPGVCLADARPPRRRKRFGRIALCLCCFSGVCHSTQSTICFLAAQRASPPPPTALVFTEEWRQRRACQPPTKPNQRGTWLLHPRARWINKPAALTRKAPFRISSPPSTRACLFVCLFVCLEM